MIATPSDDTRCGYPIEIVNEVMGTRKRIFTTQTRGQLVEGFVWGARRSTAGKCKREAFDVRVCIFADCIVMHFYCPAWKDPEAAKAAMQAIFQGVGGVL